MEQNLGEKLRQYRKIRGLTLREVEEKTEISNGYLSQLEQNHVKKPSPHVLHKLAEVYEVSYESLLKLAGYVVPKEKKEKRVSGVAFSLFKDLTSEEQDELLKYLEFLRSKKKR